MYDIDTDKLMSLIQLASAGADKLIDNKLHMRRRTQSDRLTACIDTIDIAPVSTCQSVSLGPTSVSKEALSLEIVLQSAGLCTTIYLSTHVGDFFNASPIC